MPIYSLAMPEGSKLYVITSTELISAVQRQPKTLAFPPVGVKFAMSLAGSSKEANRIATDNINGEDGDYGLSMDFNKVVYPALSPGKPLEAMYRVIVPRIKGALDNLRSGVGQEGVETTKIELASWVRHELTVAISDCVYGPGNPFRNRQVEDAFWYVSSTVKRNLNKRSWYGQTRTWGANSTDFRCLHNRDFENDLFKIMMKIVPALSARKGIQGRQLLIDAFLKYFQSGALATGSIFAQSRYASAVKHKVPLNDIARFEVVNLIGTLTSTIRTVTWMLYHIYSDPAILSSCRQEIPRILATRKGDEKEEGSNTVLERSLNVTALKSNCPILGSTFQEVLRHHALGTSIRQVMHDTVLEDCYLLKKNSMILMPSMVVHSDPQYWGTTVEQFNHRRFLKSLTPAHRNGDAKVDRTQLPLKPPPASAFRAFGGGATLCPGRHFATTVTMAVTTMFVMRYEMWPAAERRWPHLTGYKSNAIAAVEQPDQRIEVEVRPRQGFESGEWSFRMEGSELLFATVAEDQTSVR